MHKLVAAALTCATFIGVGSVVPVPAAGPTTRTLYVTVVDDEGYSVPGLTPADFAVIEGGKLRTITSVAPASEKVRLALMVEQILVGHSYVRVALAEFVARMCRSAEIALFTVSQRAEKLVDYTSDPNVARRRHPQPAGRPDPAERRLTRRGLRGGEAVREGEASTSGDRAGGHRAGSVNR